jgi:hypothetical protein
MPGFESLNLGATIPSATEEVGEGLGQAQLGGAAIQAQLAQYAQTALKPYVQALAANPALSQNPQFMSTLTQRARMFGVPVQTLVTQAQAQAQAQPQGGTAAPPAQPQPAPAGGGGQPPTTPPAPPAASPAPDAQAPGTTQSMTQGQMTAGAAQLYQKLVTAAAQNPAMAANPQFRKKLLAEAKAAGRTPQQVVQDIKAARQRLQPQQGQPAATARAPAPQGQPPAQGGASAQPAAPLAAAAATAAAAEPAQIAPMRVGENVAGLEGFFGVNPPGTLTSEQATALAQMAPANRGPWLRAQNIDPSQVSPDVLNQPQIEATQNAFGRLATEAIQNGWTPSQLVGAISSQSERWSAAGITPDDIHALETQLTGQTTQALQLKFQTLLQSGYWKQRQYDLAMQRLATLQSSDASMEQYRSLEETLIPARQALLNAQQSETLNRISVANTQLQQRWQTIQNQQGQAAIRSTIDLYRDAQSNYGNLQQLIRTTQAGQGGATNDQLAQQAAAAGQLRDAALSQLRSLGVQAPSSGPPATIDPHKLPAGAQEGRGANAGKIRYQDHIYDAKTGKIISYAGKQVDAALTASGIPSAAA